MDADVLIHLLKAGCLERVLQITQYRFVVPNHVWEEVHYRHQRLKLRKISRSGALQEAEITDPAEIDLYALYRKRFGEGESACLALAVSRGWCIASDEKAVKREMTAQPAVRYLNTESLMKVAIKEGPIS